MSWAESEWKNELSSLAIKKVDEMEKQRDRMSKEMKQNKLQVDAIEHVFILENKLLMYYKIVITIAFYYINLVLHYR